MLIPMQHINITIIFNSFSINTQSRYICKTACSKTKLSLAHWPLEVWPLQKLKVTVGMMSLPLFFLLLIAVHEKSI